MVKLLLPLEPQLLLLEQRRLLVHRLSPLGLPDYWTSLLGHLEIPRAPIPLSLLRLATALKPEVTLVSGYESRARGYGTVMRTCDILGCLLLTCRPQSARYAYY